MRAVLQENGRWFGQTASNESAKTATVSCIYSRKRKGVMALDMVTTILIVLLTIPMAVASVLSIYDRRKKRP